MLIIYAILAGQIEEVKHLRGYELPASTEFVGHAHLPVVVLNIVLGGQHILRLEFVPNTPFNTVYPVSQIHW